MNTDDKPNTKQDTIEKNRLRAFRRTIKKALVNTPKDDWQDITVEHKTVVSVDSPKDPDCPNCHALTDTRVVCDKCEWRGCDKCQVEHFMDDKCSVNTPKDHDADKCHIPFCRDCLDILKGVKKVADDILNTPREEPTCDICGLPGVLCNLAISSAMGSYPNDIEARVALASEYREDIREAIAQAEKKQLKDLQGWVERIHIYPDTDDMSDIWLQASKEIRDEIANRIKELSK